MKDKLNTNTPIVNEEQAQILLELEELQDAEELVKVLLDATPFGAVFIDEDLQIVDCNMSAVYLKGMSSKKEFFERYLDLYPLRQPDGSFSIGAMKKHREIAFKEGQHKFRWVYKLLNGEELPVEITLKRVMWHDGYRVVGFSRDLREIEKLDYEVKEANERSRIMIDNAPVACHFFNEAGEVVDCNKAALEMLGATSKEEFGLFFENFAPDSQPNGRSNTEAVKQKYEAIKDNGTLRFEWVRKHKDGREIPVYVTASRIKVKDGYQIVSYETSLSAIKDAEKRAKILLDKNPLMSSLWDFDGNIIECNEQALKVLEIKDLKEYEKGIRSFLMPEYQPDGSRSFEKINRLIKQTYDEGFVSFEWMYFNKSGEELPVETTLIRVDTFDGPQMVTYSRDLREIYKQQEKIREAENLTQAMLNEGPYSVLVIDDDGNIIECNEAAVRLYGATNKEDLIVNYFDKYIVGNKEEVRDEIKSIAKMQSAPESNEGVIKHSKGELIPVEITYRKIPWIDGKTRTLIYGYDIRELKAKMQEIEETNIQLTKAKNAAEEAEEELRKKSKLLEAVNSIAERLLPADDTDIEDKIKASLEELVHSSEADKITIWQFVEQDGVLGYQFYLEYAERERTETRFMSLDNIPYCKEKLFNREIVNISVDSLSKKEKEYFEAVNVRGILAMPLIVLNKLWGFISFDNCTNAKDFSESQVHTLQSASTILISAIHRSNATKELIEANSNLVNVKNLLSAVNKVSELIISDGLDGSTEVALNSLRMIAESVQATRMSLWQNFGEAGSIACRRLFGWRKDGEYEDYSSSTLMLDKYIPEWANTDRIESVEFIRKNMNDSLKSMELLDGCDYLMFSPLIIGSNFWGVIAIAKENSDQLFSEEEKNIILSGSVMIAEYIISSDLTKHLSMAEKSAATDGMTGLLNRTAFSVRSQMMFEHSKNNQTNLSIMFLDLDHFKNINDNYGHGFGDEVIKAFAKVLQKSLRPTDLCARYGGEEFVIILEGATDETATIVGNRIMSAVREVRFENEKDFRFTVSIGMKSGIPYEDDMLDKYIDDADFALYHAKKAGRDKLINYKDIEV